MSEMLETDVTKTYGAVTRLEGVVDQLETIIANKRLYVHLRNWRFNLKLERDRLSKIIADLED